MPLPLLALAVAAFGIGTSEFVIMGLLPDVARDLAVSIPAAGLLVSAYALGVTIGSPLVAIAVANLPRKKALLCLIAMFIAARKQSGAFARVTRIGRWGTFFQQHRF